MGINIRGRSFLTLLDFTPDEINYLLDRASEFKRMKNNGFMKGPEYIVETPGGTDTNRSMEKTTRRIILRTTRYWLWMSVPSHTDNIRQSERQDSSVPYSADFDW